MRCEKALKFLPEYVEGLMKPSKAAKLEEHLRSCPRCAREERALREAIRLASSLEVEYPPEERWEEVLREIHLRAEMEAVRAEVPAIRRLIPIAGFAALILIGSILLGSLSVHLLRSIPLARTHAPDVRAFLAGFIDEEGMRNLREAEEMIDAEGMAGPFTIEQVDQLYQPGGEVMATGEEGIIDALYPDLVKPGDYGEIDLPVKLASLSD